tara:strand:+ start:957 stop:1769 length:813 start_codon:yes stop_codon:yes gene_type:complete
MYSDKLTIYGEKDILENATAHIQEHLEGVAEDAAHFDLFVDKDKINTVKPLIKNLSLKYKFDFKWSKIEHKNWQDNWKKYFTTIEVNNSFTVVSDWEQSKKVNSLFKIIIYPGMAFGTGHHESTFMILDILPEIIKSGNSIIDVGTGSGILLIASMKLGASNGLGIEYDPVCKENFENNMKINNIGSEVRFKQISFLDQSNYACDVLIANLNKNLLLNFFDAAKVLPSQIIISGILYLDLEELMKKINQLNLKVKLLKKKNEWICLLLEK